MSVTSAKSIACFCPFVPPEWISAHGFSAVRVSPGNSSMRKTLLDGAGVCSYVKAVVGELCDTHSPFAAVVLTSTCDQMRRVGEVVEQRASIPVFLMTIPATWQTTTAAGLYREELKRLGRFLVRLGGEPPSEAQLIFHAEAFDHQRKQLRQRRGVLDGESFHAHLREFQTTGQLPPLPAEHLRRDGVRLALAGGPLRSEDGDIFSLIRHAHGDVVLDATESGEMTLAPAFSKRHLYDDPLGEIVDAYFGQIPHAMRRPNSHLYRYFQVELSRRGVQGLIWQQTMWCDLWAAESQRFAQWCSVPVLQWNTGDEHSDHVRISTRLEAFVEMLQP